MIRKEMKSLVYVGVATAGFFSGLGKKMIIKNEAEQRNYSLNEALTSGVVAAHIAQGSLDRGPLAGNSSLSARLTRGSLAGLMFSAGIIVGECVGEQLTDKKTYCK